MSAVKLWTQSCMCDSLCSDPPSHRSDRLPSQIQRAYLWGYLLLHLGVRICLGRHHHLHRLCHHLLLPAEVWGWTQWHRKGQIHLYFPVRINPAQPPSRSRFHFSLDIITLYHFAKDLQWLSSPKFGKPLLYHSKVKLEARGDSYWKWTVIGNCIYFNHYFQLSQEKKLFINFPVIFNCKSLTQSHGTLWSSCRSELKGRDTEDRSFYTSFRFLFLLLFSFAVWI